MFFLESRSKVGALCVAAYGCIISEISNDLSSIYVVELWPLK